MATILTKKKDTSGAPSAGDLTNDTGGAELAVNTADKRLYTKDSGGNVVEVGINPTSITTGTLNTSGAVVFNDAGADVDFRVEGDTDANLLFVDASADRVGIGTSSPAVKLHVATASDEVVRMVTSGTNPYISFYEGATRKAYIQYSTNTGLVLDAEPASRNIVFSTQNTERMRIDPSGNVIVGGTTAVNTGASTGNVTINGSGNAILNYSVGGSAKGWIYHDATNFELYNNIAGAIKLFTDATERMRIDSSGNVGIGTTSPNSKFEVHSDALGVEVGRFYATNASFDDHVSLFLANRNTTNNSYYFLRCRVAGVADRLLIADSGNVTNTNNSYGQISDIKTKQDIVDAASQWDDIKNVRVRKFRFKNDPTGPLQIGVVAQELETVSAGLIEEHPDFKEVEVPVLDDEGNPVLDEEGNPQVTTERQATGTVTKSVKYSILYMKAVKALQEAMERIETLEAKVAALENA